MKKAISVQVARVPFTMSSEAFETLALYLENIKKVIHPDYREETLNDIELRIAELLNQKKQNNHIIEKELIDEIVQIIGKPEEFLDHKETSNTSSELYKFDKKLFRDPDNNILGGVAAGFSHYFSVHKIVFRLFFIVLTFYQGIGILLYLFFWVILPKAKTYVEKMIMKGEEIPSQYLDQVIIDKYNSKKFLDSRALHNKLFEKLLDFIGSILIYTKNFLVNLLSRSSLAILSIAIILFLIITFLASYEILTDSITINNVKITKENALNYILLIFPSTLYAGLFFISIITLIVSLLAVLKIGYRNLTKKNGIKRAKSLYLALLALLLSFVITRVLIYFIEKNFSVQTSFILQSDNFSISEGEILHVVPNNIFAFDVLPIVLKGDSVYSSNIDFVFIKSQTDKAMFTVKAEAKGANELEAFKNIQGVRYQVYKEGNRINVFSYFSYPKYIGFRDQKIIIEIHLPVNQIIYLPENFSGHYDVFEDEESEDLLPGYYKMTEEGLIKL
ncbi:MAG: PspC domain-containing protein [Thermaurantimonas sp.]|uniref:PspC domain-containing protein n=1 Tax=Thermaurantimonas sp. TaxID=2681568 RepID=UPI00391A5264